MIKLFKLCFWWVWYVCFNIHPEAFDQMISNFLIQCTPDVPAPLATKMYHSQGNCRLRLELGQLYRESCVKHPGSYTAPNLSQKNGQVTQLSPCDNPGLLPVSQKNIILQTKVSCPHLMSIWLDTLSCSITDVCFCCAQYLDQLPSSTSELCSGIPEQLKANRPNCSKEIKTERVETQAAFKNEVSRTKCNRAAATNSKSKGWNWIPYSFM